jgi:hypothetical protein
MDNSQLECTPHLNLQDPHYGINTPVASPYTTMAPALAKSTAYATPNVLPPKASTQSSTDPLEQRILDLLYPYRDECFAEEDDTTEIKERNVLILCGTSSHHLHLQIVH